MAVSCHSKNELLVWEEKGNALYEKWRTNPSIDKRFRVNGEFMEANSEQGFREWMLEKMNRPFAADVPFTESQINLAGRWIDHYANNLNGKFSNLAWVVPEGLSKQDPFSRMLHNSMNNILNQERVNINTLGSANALISLNLVEAYMSSFGKKVGKTKLKGIKEARQKMITAETEESYDKWANKFEEIVNSDKDGQILRDFEELVSMPAAANNEFDGFKSIHKDTFRTRQNGVWKKKSYDTNTVLAAKAGRDLLKKIGLTYAMGLNKYADLAEFKYSLGNPAKGKEVKARLKEAISSLEMDIKTEGYYPHVLFDNLNQIKQKMSESFDPRNGNTINIEETTNDIIKSILEAPIDTPDQLKKRNPLLSNSYEKDPILAITTYSNEAIQFNKLVHIQDAYLKTLKNLPTNETNFTNGLSRFIQEQYAVFTEGTKGRNAFANNAVTILNSLQTAATMGLNITGAIKNAASIMHFYTRIGHKSSQDAVRAFMHNEAIGVGDNKIGFKDWVDQAEKEAGFLFTDAASELYAEGTGKLTSMLGEGKHDFDPLTGKVTFNGTPVKDLLLKAGQWTVEKGLFFHRYTENKQRQWMYRTALYHQYNKLSRMGFKSDVAKKESKDWALKMVNSWAYEYSPHAKAKMVRGEWRTVEEMGDGQVIAKRLKKGGNAGAISEVAFHLLHYPMSLAETQYDQLSKAHKAYLAGEGFESEEIQWLSRQAGIMSLITLGSVVFNSDLSNIFENETLNRLQNVAKDITEYDNDDLSTFGLLGEVTGPTIGAVKRALIAHGLIDVDESTLNKILFGNVNFADEFDEKAQRLDKYKWGTFAGTTVNKILPSLQAGRGRDLITHYLKLYPNDFTKKYNALLFNRQPEPKVNKDGYRGMSPDLKASLKLLKGISS